LDITSFYLIGKIISTYQRAIETGFDGDADQQYTTASSIL
jgi:hypothetical protein